MDLEQFIRDLPWSDQATDHEKTLVEGNLRNLYAAMVGAVRPLRAAAVELELLIDDQTDSARKSFGDKAVADTVEWMATISEGQLRKLTQALNQTQWLGAVSGD